VVVRRRADCRVAMCRGGGVARDISRCASIPRVCWVGDRQGWCLAWRSATPRSRDRMKDLLDEDVEVLWRQWQRLGHGCERARRASLGLGGSVRCTNCAGARRVRKCGAVNVSECRHSHRKRRRRALRRELDQFCRVCEGARRDDGHPPKLPAMIARGARSAFLSTARRGLRRAKLSTGTTPLIMGRYRSSPVMLRGPADYYRHHQQYRRLLARMQLDEARRH